MRFLELTVGGCVPFPNKITIQIPAAQKVAITGDNGAGKSTLLDCIYIALYGDTTKPGGLYPLFQSKDGMVDLSFQYKGHVFRIHRMIDGIARKQKVWVYQDGLCLNEGKVGQAQEAVDCAIGIPSDVFLASVYNAQTQKGNPLALKDGERRDLLSKVLGLGAYDEPHRLVAAAIQDTETQMMAAKLNYDRLVEESSQIEPVRNELATLDHEIKVSQGLIIEADDIVEKLTKQLADVEANTTDLTEVVANVERLTKALAENDTAQAATNEKLANNKSHLLDCADGIRQAAAFYATATTNVDRFRVEVSESQQALEYIQQKNDIEITAKRASFDDDARIVQGLHDESQKAAKDCEIADLTIKNLNNEIQRLSDLAALGDVPCKGEGEFASCPLIANRKNAATTLADKKAEMIQLMNGLGALNQKATESRQAYEVAQSEYDQRFLVFTEWLKAVENSNASNRETHTNLVKRLQEEEKTAEEFKKSASLLPHLELAGEKIEEYTRQLASLNDQKAIDTQELNRWQQRQLALQDVAKTAGDLKAKIANERGARAGLSSGLDTLHRQHGQKSMMLATALKAKEDMEELENRQLCNSSNLSNLTILKQALGPKGVKALKVDSAGPAISELANTLLAECFGPRFTIVILTQRSLVSDKDELRECLEFSIIDNDTGAESPVDQKSGGEQQLIREVISLALCIYQRKQTGGDIRTIIRDESCSALTEANSIKYVAMLEKACEIGEFDQVFFVSHKKVAQGLADAVIHVSSGKVEQ